MLKQMGFVAVFVFFCISITVGLAEESITASLSNKDVIVGLNNITVVNLTIKNPQNTSSTFSASIQGSYPKTIILENKFVVVGNSTVFKAITINPTEDIGRFPLTVYLEAQENSQINFSLPLNLWVQHPDKYILKNFEGKVQNNKVTGKITLKPDDKIKTNFVFDILDINGKVAKSAELSQEIEKEATIENSIDVSDLPTGKYSLRVSIKDTILSKSTNFDIGLSRSVKQDRKITSGLLYDEVEISLYNYGNLVENDYKVYEEIPKGQFITLITNSTDLIKSDQNVKYEFTLDKIRPGEVAIIKYRVEKWQNLLMYLAGLVVLIAVVVYALLMNTKPKIRKSSVRMGKGQFSIILEVKNNGLTEMKDVIVRDFLQPIAKIKSTESGGLSPNIRSSQLGTELLWKLGSLMKGEVRVLSYSIDALLHAESLKLSTATMNYVTGRKNRGLIRSNELTVQ